MKYSDIATEHNDNSSPAPTRTPLLLTSWARRSIDAGGNWLRIAKISLMDYIVRCAQRGALPVASDILVATPVK